MKLPVNDGRDQIEQLSEALWRSMDREEKVEEKFWKLFSEQNRLKEACNEFRDAVLHGRHQLEEPCLDNDQTNAVLGLFDDIIGEAIKGG